MAKIIYQGTLAFVPFSRPNGTGVFTKNSAEFMNAIPTIAEDIVLDNGVKILAIIFNDKGDRSPLTTVELYYDDSECSEPWVPHSIVINKEFALCCAHATMEPSETHAVLKLHRRSKFVTNNGVSLPGGIFNIAIA